jgi:hypothetical protein
MGSLSPARQALIDKTLKARRAASNRIPPRDPGEPVPLSFSQLRLWFLQQWEPDAPTFNAVRAIRLHGELDVEALRRALNAVVARHEALRTVVVAESGEPRQQVLEAPDVELPVIDLGATPPTEREDELRVAMRELAREPFDLGADLMIRATLFRLAEREHVFLLRLHHIAGDAFSAGLMFAELGALYSANRAGRAIELSAPVQFADFAVWQRRRLQGPLLDELVGYWVRKLEGAPELLNLPTDRPRREIQRHAGAHEHFALPAELARGVERLGREEGATLYMVALAAFATLLYRLGGEDDVVIGSPFANRTHSELQHVFGFLSNTVALRVRLSGNPSFREVLGRARESTLEALAYQEMPFEQVIGALKLPRHAGHNPLFQVNLRAQATPPALPQMEGLEVGSLDVDIGYSRFDLALELQGGPDGLSGYFEYDLDLFDPQTVTGFVDALTQLLEQALANPDQPVLALALPARPARRPAAMRARPTRRGATSRPEDQTT